MVQVAIHLLRHLLGGLDQVIDIETVAMVGGHPPSGGVGLKQQPCPL
jgi:hypothetical protein